MKKAIKKTDVVDGAELIDLAREVRTRMGVGMIEALGKQPMAMAGGGIEVMLQRACEVCAGYPHPVESAVRTLRVWCGSAAEPTKTEAP